MNTTINAVKFKADEKLEKFVNEKVSKLDRLIDNATKCEVNLKVDKPESDNNKIAELSLNLPGQTLFNSKQADTFEEAVAQCVDSMKVQIEKYKERYNR
jgi:putative sigma-54 modulation protein